MRFYLDYIVDGDEVTMTGDSDRVTITYDTIAHSGALFKRQFMEFDMDTWRRIVADVDAKLKE